MTEVSSGIINFYLKVECKSQGLVMSKLYRSVWNEALDAWVAIAEIEGSSGTSNSFEPINHKTNKLSCTASRIMQATTLGLLASSMAHGGVPLNVAQITYSNHNVRVSACYTQVRAAEFKVDAYAYKISNYWFTDDRNGIKRVLFSPVNTVVIDLKSEQFLEKALAYFKTLAKTHHELMLSSKVLAPANDISDRINGLIAYDSDGFKQLSESLKVDNITFSSARVTGQASMVPTRAGLITAGFVAKPSHAIVDNHNLRIIVADPLFLKDSAIFNADSVLNNELTIQKTHIELS